MPYDATRAADARGWLRKAADDLRGAEIDLAATPPLPGDAAFHCQQATEKALKAFLTWHDLPFRKTHDLAEIGQRCVAADGTLEAMCREAERLTAFAWIFRYPGDVGEPPPEEVADALVLARRVYDAVLARLPAELPP
jgi:HEPN domain-containing protein